MNEALILYIKSRRPYEYEDQSEAKRIVGRRNTMVQSNESIDMPKVPLFYEYEDQSDAP